MSARRISSRWTCWLGWGAKPFASARTRRKVSTATGRAESSAIAFGASAALAATFSIDGIDFMGATEVSAMRGADSRARSATARSALGDGVGGAIVAVVGTDTDGATGAGRLAGGTVAGCSNFDKAVVDVW